MTSPERITIHLVDQKIGKENYKFSYLLFEKHKNSQTKILFHLFMTNSSV